MNTSSNQESGTGSRSRGLEGKRVSILGLGASGEAAARLALYQGGEVYVSDLRSEAAVAAGAAQLGALGAEVDLGDHDLRRIAASDLVVVSPGIPPDAPVLRGLRARDVPWISEPEFAFRFFRSPLIAVTGTNGKTTTAVLTAHLLRQGGREVGLGGNIGGGMGPAASVLAMEEPAPDWIVLEVSSFQLADVDRFCPDIGMVTNLAPDHLDRYPSVAAYFADKANLFRNASPGSRWILDGDNPEVEALAGDAPGSRFRVSLTGPKGPGGWVEDEADGVTRLMMDLGKGPTALLDSRELPLLGAHNRANALFAAVAAGLAGVSRDDLERGLRSAPSIPHRLEPVGETRGVLWVNDSKATNVAAACSALRSLDRTAVVLLGGKDKGEDLSALAGAIRDAGDRVRALVVFGAARDRFARDLEGTAPMTLETGPFEAAVATGAKLARAGDILLLSPACSSFDMFDNYQARGDRFRELAREAAL